MNEYEVVLREIAFGYVTVSAKDETEAALIAKNSADVDWADPHACELVSVKLVGKFDDDDIEDEE
jgi:hypothetical protein